MCWSVNNSIFFTIILLIVLNIGWIQLGKLGLKVIWQILISTSRRKEDGYNTNSYVQFMKEVKVILLWKWKKVKGLVTQSCPNLCKPMNRTRPGLPVHHQLPEFTQTHEHWVGDAIRPSHPLSSPSPPAPIPPRIRVFYNESTFWGGQNIGVSASASVLPMNTQEWSPLGCTAWISLQSKGLSRVFSNTTVQKHQFFSAQISL